MPASPAEGLPAEGLPADDGLERQIRAARQQIAFLWREVHEVRDQLADALERIRALEGGEPSAEP
jgi:hypothetical protein